MMNIDDDVSYCRKYWPQCVYSTHEYLQATTNIHNTARWRRDTTANHHTGHGDSFNTGDLVDLRRKQTTTHIYTL